MGMYVYKVTIALTVPKASAIAFNYKSDARWAQNTHTKLEELKRKENVSFTRFISRLYVQVLSKLGSW